MMWGGGRGLVFFIIYSLGQMTIPFPCLQVSLSILPVCCGGRARGRG